MGSNKVTPNKHNLVQDTKLSIDKKLILGDAGEYIVGDGTDLDIVSSNELTLDTAASQYFDSGSGTFFFMDDGDSTERCRIRVTGGSGATLFTTYSETAVGHLQFTIDGHVEFNACGVGFNLKTPTYNASDTDVDFTAGNKQFVTFGAGNITDLNLIYIDSTVTGEGVRYTYFT